MAGDRLKQPMNVGFSSWHPDM